MGQRYEQLSDKHIEFIGEQHIFFVGTATADSRVNVSPKGMDSLRVLGPNRIIWLNVTGSGNETAAHIQTHPRMTLMFCAFQGAPLILRTYGTATVVHMGGAGWDELAAHFPALPGMRQIFDLSVDLVQSSCGMAVPTYTYDSDRDLLSNWAIKQGDDGLVEYRERKNSVSLDGIPIVMS